MPFPTAVGFSGERCEDCLQLKQNEFVIRSSMSIIVCQAQILVASIVDVGVGAQVRLSLLIFISGDVPGFPCNGGSRRQVLAVNLAGSRWQQIRGGTV